MAKIEKFVAGLPTETVSGRLLLADTVTRIAKVIYLYDSAGTAKTYTSYLFATFAGLEWATLQDTYYKEYFDRVMDEFKLVRARMLLPANVVQDFSPETPVFIKQLGCNFYVNKIENYIAGEMCIVELIRL